MNLRKARVRLNRSYAMARDPFKALRSARAKVARLEAVIAEQLHDKLAGLPAQYGFDSVRAFVKAVKSAARGGRARKLHTENAERRRSGKRAKITDATRAEVKKLVEAGNTGAEIARAVGISLPSVQNIKRALGLVKTRK
jgi:hypothetical protein